MLYRAFPLLPGARAGEPGHALFVARPAQGSGRHDNPDAYGALYAARAPESAVAERIQHLRGHTLDDVDLQRAGGRLALAALDDSSLDDLCDLDDARELARRSLRPSRFATRRRAVTQRVARTVFDDGASGLAWWSVLEASWTNVTLFAERCATRLALARDPEVLSLDHPAVVAAAAELGVARGR